MPKHQLRYNHAIVWLSITYLVPVLKYLRELLFPASFEPGPTGVSGVQTCLFII